MVATRVSPGAAMASGTWALAAANGRTRTAHAKAIGGKRFMALILVVRGSEDPLLVGRDEKGVLRDQDRRAVPCGAAQPGFALTLPWTSPPRLRPTPGPNRR